MIIKTSINILLILIFVNFTGLQTDCSPKTQDADSVNNNSTRLKKISSLGIVRSVHTATLLQDGKVLIAGGMNNSQNPIADAELFDPKSNSFKTISKMQVRRVGHVAVSLKNGEVLLVGGFDSRYSTKTAEIYDPEKREFRSVGQMKIARGGHF